MKTDFNAAVHNKGEILTRYDDFLKTQMPDFHHIENGDNFDSLTRLLLLANGHGRSVAITGGRGVGKKTLIRALVSEQRNPRVPPQLMSRPIYRLNVSRLFSSSTPADITTNITKALDTLRTIHMTRGVKPLLVIDDGAGFINGVSNGNHDSLIHMLHDADNLSNYLDLVFVASQQSLKELHESYPTFMTDVSEFQVESPTPDTLLKILQKKAEIYARQHIQISDDVLRKIIAITGRYPKLYPYEQPKRSIRFLDELAIGYQLKMYSKPQGYFDKQSMLDSLELQISSPQTREEDKETLLSQRDALRIEIENDLAQWGSLRQNAIKLQDEIYSFEEMIAAKKAKVLELEANNRAKIAAVGRRQLIDEAEEHENAEQTIGKINALSDDEVIERLKIDLNLHQDPKVTEMVAEITKYQANVKAINGRLTGISGALQFPITISEKFVEELSRKLTKTVINPDRERSMMDSEEILNRTVLDQPCMNRAIAQSLRVAAAGGNDPEKPVGVFLILGPSGVGKTFVAETMAEMIYGSKTALTTFNMEGYSQEHTVSQLIGAPVGYVGYGESGALISAAQKNPDSVILLDEIEKAHKTIKQTLLTALEKGRITGMDGEVGDLRGAVIVMTSNYGQDVFLRNDISLTEAQDIVRDRIYRDGHFSPEFLNRTTLVFANFLSPEAVQQIAQREVKQLERRYQAKNPTLSIGFSDDAAKAFVEHIYKREQGARIVKSTVTNSLADIIAQKILMARQTARTALSGHFELSYSASSGFICELRETQREPAPAAQVTLPVQAAFAPVR